MDAKESRTNSTLGSSVSDGSNKYAHSSPTLQTNRIKTYHDISSNSMGKMDATTSRPCAIIGPDRVLPSNSGDVYLKKTVEPWPCQENVYRHTTEYQNKMPEYQPNRNISPRQTFQENMQRIMVPPTYNSIKIPEESSSKNTKLNMPHEAKYCDVPYNNPVNNELKSVRNPDIPINNMNPAYSRSVPPYGWPSGVNVRPLRPYGAADFYQYSEYPSCAGPRPMPMVRQHQALNGETTQMYPEHLYQESNIRFKPYPLAKERHQQVRYDYISNYPNTFHPPNPFPSHRYDLQKSIHGHPYPVYPQIPVKYLDRRIHEPITDSYQRTPNPANFNISYRNQPVAPTYGPLSGNCIQNKPYPDGSSKSDNKLPFESNSKVYVDLEPKHNKGYPIPDNIYLNEMNHHQSLRGDILLPPHSTLNMHTVPQHAIYRKDNMYPKNFEYNIPYRNFDQSVNNPLVRFPLQYSPNTLAISPSDSNTSNDTAHTLGTSQEDCGYVSQSSTTSVRSLDSFNLQATNDALRRHNYNIYGRNNITGKEMLAKRKNSSSDKKNINVRQFLQMWNDDDDVSESNKESVTTNNSGKNCEEPLYVLDLVNVPSNEIGKYEHIQKISKLPENIKGYNSLELLNQYEELLEPSNSDKYSPKPFISRQCNTSLRNIINKEHVTIPRPVSPLDVEAKISQSVIHKEVGCNFEIKPCSPEMLNVEVATPAQNILGERTIEKVINPAISHSPLQHADENNLQNSNVIKNASCKMINHSYSPDPSINSIKENNYSVQDLETNAGVCLASLPQLDNDLELNFPEINQQFINANKNVSHTPSKDSRLLDIDQKSNILHEKSRHQPNNLLSPKTSSGSEKEVSKLSKYRKNKKVELPIPSPNDFVKQMVSTLATQRIDSVIIKNPDNIKSQELQANTNYSFNTLLEDNNSSINNNNLTLEKAIDFSLNKMEVDIPVVENILNNNKSTEKHVTEDHCDLMVTCDNMNVDVVMDKDNLTRLSQDNYAVDQMTVSENKPGSPKVEKDEPILQQNDVVGSDKQIITSDTIPDNDEMQQNKFLIKLTENICVEEHHGPKITSDNKPEDTEIRQEKLVLDLHQGKEEVNCGKYTISENVAENLEMKQDILPNAHQFTISNNSTFEDILSHDKRDTSEEKMFNNSIYIGNNNNASILESPVLSVIHETESVNNVSLFSEVQTCDIDKNININQKGNEVLITNKNELLISDTSTDKARDVTIPFAGISLPILENIPNTDSQIFETISDNASESIEKFTVDDVDKITNIGKENVLNKTKDITNSIIVQKEDRDSISAIKRFIDNSLDTNSSKTETVFEEETLIVNSVLNIKYSNCNGTQISCSNTKPEKPKKENIEAEEQDVHKINVDSENNDPDYNKNCIPLNGTSSGDNTTKLQLIQSEKILDTGHCGKSIAKNEVVTEKLHVTESNSKSLLSLSQELPIPEENNTKTTTTVKCNSKFNVALASDDKHHKENGLHNDLDISFKLPLIQNECVEVDNNGNVELNANELSNQNSCLLNKVENTDIDTKICTDKEIASENAKFCFEINELSYHNPPFYQKKVHKSLFSPWIQKLVMYTEGIYRINQHMSSKDVVHENLNDFQLTPKSSESKDDTEIKEECIKFTNEDTNKSVKENDIQENVNDTADNTLLLILSTDNPKDEIKPGNEVKDCVVTAHALSNEETAQKFENSPEHEIVVPTKPNKKLQFFGNKPQRILKRSLSESAIDNRCNDNSNLLIPIKRRKENNILQSHITAEDLCNIVQNNRRNSVSTFYKEENVYILIDNDLIITEESVDSEKICYGDTDQCIPNEECEPLYEKKNTPLNDSSRCESIESDDCPNEFQSGDEKSAEESWVENVACIETVFSDDIAEDVTIDETTSPKISNEEDSDTENDDSQIYQEMCESEHINKIRNIYGSSVSNENVQLLETLYRTPQMDVNKTLVDIESHNLETCLQEETLKPKIHENDSDGFEKNMFLSHCSSLIDDKENLSNDSMLESKALKTYSGIEDNDVNLIFPNDKSLTECMAHSCEPSNDNFISHSQKENSRYSYSSSPEVSSTTSEEKGILLKITNYNGSRSSQINEITADNINKISYKLTENKEYHTYKSHFSSTRTLITKAAQKYIPPIKETIGDLKVKLPLPQHHLNKLKQLKKTKIEPKITENIIRYKNRNLKAEIPKKVKPKFEDVLKSIDEMQFKKRKDKLKRGKSEIPKVVIKKSENGAHYTSTNSLNNNEAYNPDLTGRKWQPWVFLEKNNFIDRMAIKKKYKAVYCHRKKLTFWPTSFVNINQFITRSL